MGLPPPPAGDQQLASDPYTLQGGQEKYYCYTFRSPDREAAVTAVQALSGQLVHHVALFQTTTPEPEGFHECNVLIRTSWRPIWAGGTGRRDFRPCVEARASLCDRPSLPPRGEPRGYPVRSPASAGLVAVAWNARGPRMRAFRKVASGFTPGRAPSSAPGPREL